jgi:arginyl-tRNA synthetase
MTFAWVILCALVLFCYSLWMIRTRILDQLSLALTQAAPQLNGLTVDSAVLSGLKLERPRSPEHGDYAVNVSFLARHTKMAPPKIAEIIAPHWPDPAFEVSVIGGYLNIRLTEAVFCQALTEIIHNDSPGLNNSLADEKILLEYVSANPTGPLHIGHGRWAALGDSIVRILRHCGAMVTAEFYVNDAGVQMRNIAQSVLLRTREVLLERELLSKDISRVVAEMPYPGDYVVEISREVLDAQPELLTTLVSFWHDLLHEIPDGPILWDDHSATVPPEVLQAILVYTRDRMLGVQRTLLDTMRVPFESWISEKAYLYDRDIISPTLKRLVDQGMTYEAEDALWFKSTEFGDEKDRVLRKSDGNYTYLTPDIAYHHDKFTRPEGYNRILNIWGADHHGYIPRMRGAIQALGHNPEQFEVLLGQLVNLIVDGERTRMGKRRKMLTLQDVVDEVGVDATRFWMVSKSADNALDFDIDLAASSSSENPVFYVQYAHARCSSILRNAVESAPNVDTGELNPPFVDAAALASFEGELTPEMLTLLFASLTDPREKTVLGNLVLILDSFEDTVKDAARMRAPHFITQALMDVSAQFHSFYGVCRILTPETSVTLARLMLIRAIQKILAQGLSLLGVSAPEKM